MAGDRDMETLGAYLDGELGSAEALGLESRLRREPALAETLQKLRENQTLLRAAFNATTDGTVPARVRTSLRAVRPERRRAPRRERFERLFGPVGLAAAAAAAFATAAPVGFFAAEQQFETRLAQHMEQHREEIQADRLALAQVVSDALERKVSGEALTWQNLESGSRISITPIRTFKNTDGTWCREYAEVAQFDGSEDRTWAIACRVGEGIWQKRLEAFKER